MKKMLDFENTQQRLMAAKDIFAESTTTVGRLRSIQTLLSGIHPHLDQRLSAYNRQLSALEHIENDELIELAASEALPENTKEEKKRKAMLLLFLKSWKDLKAETARVEQELKNAQEHGHTPSTIAKIFQKAKGPLALVTVLALGIGLLKTTSVDIVVHNEGCPTLYAASKVPITVPGLSLPNHNIPSGGSATVVIPPLTLHVDGTQKGAMTIEALRFNLSFNLPGVNKVTFNETSLIGAKTSIDLSEQKKHSLVLSCE